MARGTPQRLIERERMRYSCEERSLAPLLTKLTSSPLSEHRSGADDRRRSRPARLKPRLRRVDREGRKWRNRKDLLGTGVARVDRRVRLVSGEVKVEVNDRKLEAYSGRETCA